MSLAGGVNAYDHEVVPLAVLKIGVALVTNDVPFQYLEPLFSSATLTFATPLGSDAVPQIPVSVPEEHLFAKPAAL